MLEDKTHGPQLCTGITASEPAQCGGPDIVGWSWDGLPHSASRGTKMGSFDLTGTWDGSRFTLTQKPEPPTYISTRQPYVDFASPCPPPPGGWKPVDPARATNDALQAAQTMANASPDFGGLWIDETLPPGLPTPMNNPARLVLNIRFTKDLADHEAQLRKVWGGSLCLSLAKRSKAELDRIQQELTTEGKVTLGSHPILEIVEIGVWVAYESRQRELDAKYGPGVVILTGLLTPID